MPRFGVGQFMKHKKHLREQIIMGNRQMEELTKELEEVEENVRTKEKVLKGKNDRLQYLEGKVK
jgi:argininosuccinate lyase